MNTSLFTVILWAKVVHTDHGVIGVSFSVHEQIFLVKKVQNFHRLAFAGREVVPEFSVDVLFDLDRFADFFVVFFDLLAQIQGGFARMSPKCSKMAG